METFEHDGWKTHKWVTGFLSSNVYLILPDGDAKVGALVDAGGSSGAVIKFCRNNDIELKYIFLTHRHGDHTLAASKISRKTGAEIIMNTKDRKRLLKVSTSADDGARFKLEDFSLEIVSTPGHTPGGITLLVPGAMFTGDTLFAGGAGRTDMRGGDTRALMESLKKLMEYPEDLVVYPGHGPQSTVGHEKRYNPFLR